MTGRLEKIKAELQKAQQKRDDWEHRVKVLEKKYQETEKTMIHEMVHAANITPEQLAQLIRDAVTSVPGALVQKTDEKQEDVR